MALFVARIPRDMNNRELEDAFSKYGKITRFEVKREGFGFVEFDDKRDAEDAMKGMHESIAELVVEWAKNGGKRPSDNECYHCGKSGHFARDCKDRSRQRYRPRPYDRRYRRDDRRARSPYRDEQRYDRRPRRDYRSYDDRRDDQQQPEQQQQRQ
ncbi:hypothetical protein BCV72DRAFT_256547 [Rhizopus microsporus var. microsporus]|uniref:RNA-binding domain-containing protein n=2 Tax=Rhizopus microsporus TaxID=58291 RepID=A0A2G4T622_RHIZD|nr:uncharacterized protein RHIMIDRAFT_266144 [Rhizopus microsporus ATCC 52813]ORE05935.1 hypothetical protein BCV72DRAFT_256547 [Rhizopus microsporus var. microsporus]PHZ16457.1 hypothetical protein RHIMIDRAFT_266144 [Rhizopus microsporus ATCC 52813]